MLIRFRFSLIAASVAVLTLPGHAQQAAEPAPAGGNIPPVEVVQKPKAKAVTASKKAPAKKNPV